MTIKEQRELAIKAIPVLKQIITIDFDGFFIGPWKYVKRKHK